ncbi:MAG: ribosomal protein S18-alanine N-acetyltransferase [Gammaproteobacteria bacterium]|nr:ribosomal protein S18-alanine N-acetyltransferase [Gammaproteobacteria bacterium]
MRESDVAAVVAVEREAYEFPWSEGVFCDCLRVGYCCWVLQSGAGIAGYAIMSVGAGEAHLLNLCIAPAAQGLGYGRNLLTHMLGVARTHHAGATYLEVRPSNATGLALYRSAGFALVGTRRSYYPARSGREDALILSLELRDDCAPQA